MEKTPDVTDEELKKYKPCYENHRIRAFTQTIPVSEDAIEVRMEIKYEKNTEGKIIVSGKTNLFDGAQLLISSLRMENFMVQVLQSKLFKWNIYFSTLRKWNESFGEMQIEYYDACKFCTTNRICKKVR